MPSLLDHIAKSYGEEDRVRHTEIFNAFSLPDPDDGEWLEGLGCDITLINMYGLVFKTLPKSGYRQHISFGQTAFVLQPLKQIEFRNSCLMILPGVSLSPVGKSETNPIRFIDSRLAEEEVKAEDIREENIGFIPPTAGYSLPVLVDHGCVQGKVSDPFLFPKCDTDHTKYQKNAFRDIKSRIQSFWSGKLPSSSQGFYDFLSYCNQQAELAPNTQDKKLYNGWMEISDGKRSDFKPLKAKRSASRYHKRMKLN